VVALNLAQLANVGARTVAAQELEQAAQRLVHARSALEDAPVARIVAEVGAIAMTATTAVDPLTRATVVGASGGSDWRWAVVLGAVEGCRPGAVGDDVAAIGDDVSAAALIGAEIAHACAVALGPEHGTVWNWAGSVGSIAAAVTAGLLLRLDDVALGQAISIAASLTGGQRGQDGSMLEPLIVGQAAANGVLAATLAACGTTGSPTALEGPRGIFFAYGDATAAQRLLPNGFGSTWAALDEPAPSIAAAQSPTPVPESGLALAFAEFSSKLTIADVPDSVVHAAHRAIVNTAALAVDAADHPAVQIVAQALTDLESTGDVVALGRDEPVSPYAAAMLMGYAMHVEDFDDTHLQTVLHPGAPVVSAALAAAELVGASGADTVAGVIAGIEVGSRLGIAFGPSHFDHAWHITGTVGHVGAAVAAARVLGLDSVQTWHAIAIATNQAAGVTEQLGSMTKALHVGRSGADGLQAALLARAGVTAAEPFDGPSGAAAAFSDTFEPDVALDGLGKTWEIEANAFKPYSCGIVSHPVIDAAIAARADGLGADDIVRVVAVIRPVVLEVMGVIEPTDGLQSKFSVYHCFAVGLLDGGAGPAQYTDARATDDVVVSVRRKVETVLDPDMPKDACRVSVWDRSGAEHVYVIEHATGSVDSPMTDAQLADKVRLLVEPHLGNGQQELWQSAMTLAEAPDLQRLFAASRRVGALA
jgi:2-methylcitrate dehydratase PrpD